MLSATERHAQHADETRDYKPYRPAYGRLPVRNSEAFAAAFRGAAGAGLGVAGGVEASVLPSNRPMNDASFVIAAIVVSAPVAVTLSYVRKSYFAKKWRPLVERGGGTLSVKFGFSSTRLEATVRRASVLVNVKYEKQGRGSRTEVHARRHADAQPLEGPAYRVRTSAFSDGGAGKGVMLNDDPEFDKRFIVELDTPTALLALTRDVQLKLVKLSGSRLVMPVQLRSDGETIVFSRPGYMEPEMLDAVIDLISDLAS